MVDFLDIAPATESVPLAGATVSVFGVSLKTLLNIVTRFPKVRAAFSGGEYTVEELVAEAPEAVAVIIAAGIGHPDEPDYIIKAATLNVEDQLSILDAMIKLTLPKGLASFLERLQRLSADIGVAAPGPLPASNLPKPSSE